MRHLVAVCAGGGMSHEEIAIGLGISRNTLEKYFESELSVGAIAKRQEVLDAMFKAAKHGNVTAQRAFIAMTPPLATPPLPKEPKAKPAGKKEQEQADAVTAHQGTDWEDILKPDSPLQ